MSVNVATFGDDGQDCDSPFCGHMAQATYEYGDSLELNIYLFVQSVVQLLVFGFYMIQYAVQKARLSSGRDFESIEKIIVLPFHHAILVLFGCVAVLDCVFSLLYSLPRDVYRPPQKKNSLAATIVPIIPLALWSGLWAGTMVFLSFGGAGFKSIRRFAITVVIVSFFTCLVRVLSGIFALKWLSLIYALLLLVAYGLVTFAPESVLRKRPGSQIMGGFLIFWYASEVAIMGLSLGGCSDALCVFVIRNLALLSVVQPAAIYKSLLRDSAFWQGNWFPEESTREKSLGEATELASVSTPLTGSTLNAETAVSIAESIDMVRSDCILNWGRVKLPLGNSGISLLGAGGTAKVFKGSFDGKDVAVKIAFCVELTPEVVQEVIQEAKISYALRHPNIVQFKGLCIMPPALCLVFELCKSSLDEYLSSKASWAVDDLIKISIDCARGVSFLHKRKPSIVHGDIKSKNFLVSEDGSVKLADLATCSSVAEGMHVEFSGVPSQTLSHTDSTSANRTRMGSLFLPQGGTGMGSERFAPQWCSPEILAGASETPSSDVYALGVTLWEVFHQRLPFDDREDTASNPAILSQEIMSGQTRLRWSTSLPEAVTQLGEDMLSVDPESRPTAQEVLLRLRKMVRASE